MHITIRSRNAPTYLHGPILIDSYGLPRFWPTVWALLTMNGRAEATRSKKLRHIEQFYQFSEARHQPCGLEDAIARADLGYLGNVLEGYLIHLSNHDAPPLNTQRKWETTIEFIRDIISRFRDGLSHRNDIHQIEAKLNRLDLLYGQLRVGRPRTQNNLRALPEAVVDALYELLDPATPANPFRSEKVRWTVYIALVLLLHLGLRRGELLLLPLDAVKSQFDDALGRIRYWVNVCHTKCDLVDPRYTRPSIKNASSLRQIPVSATVAKIIQTYIENYRGKQQHPFLLTSQKKNPLSAEGLTKQFLKISAALPQPVKKLLEDRRGSTCVSMHDLRHTSAVARLNLLLANGTPMDEALQQLRSFFGWSRKSPMPLLYARAVFEERLASVWTQKFDDRTEMIRALARQEAI